MRFLQKPDATPPEFTGLTYATKTHRGRIRKHLETLQRRFCAYSEHWLGESLDSEEVEHFNDDLKGGDGDSFFNWYAVLRRVDQLKMGKHWHNYQPLPEPYTKDVQQRIIYTGGQFCPRDSTDVPISNLIKFTGANDYEVMDDRRNHLSRLRWYKAVLPEDDFLKMFEHDPPQLSFPTALKAELNIPAFEIIERLHSQTVTP
jgi:hypothetical protein